MSALFDRLAELFERGHRAPVDGLLSDERFAQASRTADAAVLIAVTERPDPGVILTRRPQGMRDHPGQVAFPGGKLDPGEDAVRAALREAHEELAIDPANVRVIGTTDRYQTGTGFDVTPVLGLVPPDLPIVPNPDEVEAWFEAPLRVLLEREHWSEHEVYWQGAQRRYLQLDWQGFRIWGVTAAIIANLARRLEIRELLDGELLPLAPWTQRADLAALVDALGVDQVRWVGGAVRDTLLGLPVKDIDAATPLLPDEVIARLNAAGIGTVPTGIEHGTITALLAGGPVEVTTLRHDVSTDGRRATVAFAREWRDDAARRDFTINALYAHPETLEISDWFGGLGDLAARRVRFIGDARERIREDHLRILRYFRFKARFGSEVDQQSEDACRDLAHTLKGLSRERVAMELLALLGLPDPRPTVERMAELGVLEVILPEAGKAGLAALRALVAAEEASAIDANALRRLAALLPPSPPVAEAVAARLRLSKAQRARLIAAAERTGSDPASPRALAYAEGTESAVDRLLLAGADPAPVIGWQVPELPLKGGEIVARGVGAGPDVARTLREVERRWVAEGFPARARVLELLDEMLGAA